MAVKAGTLIRPLASADYKSKSSLKKGGLLLIPVGIMVAMVALISSIIQADRGASDASIAAQAAWTFGVATVALITIKSGIALILWGIVRRIWIRIESLKEALPNLMSKDAQPGTIHEGSITTPYGAGKTTRKAPGSLPIHRMAYALWAPMLIMGVMLVGIGLVLSFFEADKAFSSDPDTFQTLRALVPGILFLGEGLVLAGISFLLGTILGSLREGGGEVQESLGLGVKTLTMPLTAKLFLVLMMMGVMVEMIQFGLYIFVATLDPATEFSTINAYHAWLGPLRELGLGLLLSGIVLALGTIGKVLDFQFHRISEIISTGR